MRWSWLFNLIFLVGAILGGCASLKPSKGPPKGEQAAAGSLVIFNPANLLGAATLPAEFVTDRNYSPMWLVQNEIAIAGSTNGKSVVVGVSGSNPEQQRVIAEDYGAGAPDGVLMDFAVSPDGAQIATVFADSDRTHIQVMVRPAEHDDRWQSIVTMPGAFVVARISWINPALLALTLHSDDPAHRGVTEGSLELVTLGNQPVVKVLDQIQCPVRDLSFSPNGQLAVTQSDRDAMQWLIYLGRQNCHELAASQPLRVIGWAPDSSSFLYFTVGDTEVPGVYSYSVAKGAGSLVAISSGAAAYARDATIVALGNDDLTWGRAAQAPYKIVIAQIALRQSSSSELIINSLGLPLTPAILSRSKMRFSLASQNALIDTAVVTARGTTQELIKYSYPTRSAAVLVAAPPDEALSPAWSPNGAAIVVVDTTSHPNFVTVLSPSR